VNGVDIRQSDIALAEEDLGAEMRKFARSARPPSRFADIIASQRPSKKLRKHEFKRRRAAQQGADGACAAGRGQGCAHRRGLPQGLRRRGQVDDAAGRGARPPYLGENEEEAKAIAEQIKGGADFATLAKEKSKDPGAADGGDLGFFTKDQMVPEFADVAFKMYPGQVSNPVKTQFGWHVIKLEDKRTKPIPEFEKVKDQIETFLTRKAQTEYVAKLRQNGRSSASTSQPSEEVSRRA
jgi:peptidyl-prolyl cis-trans isomerase C